MTLATLRRTDPESRSAALTEIAALLLPDPFDNRDVQPSQLVQSALGELAEKVTASRGQEFASMLKQRLVTKELRDSLISSEKISSIRKRIGQNGLLSTSLYDVTFRQNFLELNMSLGISRSLVQQTIANPARVEHLFPEQSGIANIDQQSLFKGPVPGFPGACVLILAVRNLEKLEVDGAWLIFYGDVEVDPAASPLETLKAFTSRYGFTVTAGNTKAKFILFETFDLQPGTTNVVHFEHPERLADVRLSFSMSPLGILKVGLAFGIDVVTYAADLRKHGVLVTRAFKELAKT